MGILFQAASEFTFGFVHDATTAAVALVFFGVLSMGLEHLFEMLHSASASKAFQRAGHYLGLMRSDEQLYGKDSAEYDYHSRVYSSLMSSSVNHSFAGRRAAFEPDIIYDGGDIAESSEDSQGYVFDETVFNYGEFSGYGDVDSGYPKLSSSAGLLGGPSFDGTDSHFGTSSDGSGSSWHADDPGPSDVHRPHFDDED